MTIIKSSFKSFMIWKHNVVFSSGLFKFPRLCFCSKVKWLAERNSTLLSWEFLSTGFLTSLNWHSVKFLYTCCCQYWLVSSRITRISTTSDYRVSQKKCPHFVGIGWKMGTFFLGHPVLHPCIRILPSIRISSKVPAWVISNLYKTSLTYP